MLEHLFNEDGEGLMEFLKGDKLHQVMDKVTTLCSPNVRKLMVLFKHHSGKKGYIDKILVLKFRNVVITFRILDFLNIAEKIFLFKMSIEGDGSGCDLVKRCNLKAILKHVGSCLIISSVLDGWPRLATCMIQFTIK